MVMLPIIFSLTWISISLLPFAISPSCLSLSLFLPQLLTLSTFLCPLVEPFSKRTTIKTVKWNFVFEFICLLAVNETWRLSIYLSIYISIHVLCAQCMFASVEYIWFIVKCWFCFGIAHTAYVYIYICRMECSMLVLLLLLLLLLYVCYIVFCWFHSPDGVRA